MNDQQIQTETVEPIEPHVETGNMTQQQARIAAEEQLQQTRQLWSMKDT